METKYELKEEKWQYGKNYHSSQDKYKGIYLLFLTELSHYWFILISPLKKKLQLVPIKLCR